VRRSAKAPARDQVTHRRFAPQEFLLIAYEPHNHSVFSQRIFDDLQEISSPLKESNCGESVRSLLDVPLFDLADAALTADVDPSRCAIREQNYPVDDLKRAFDGHPIYEDLITNKERTATAVQVLFRSDEQIKRLSGRVVDIQRKTLREKLRRGEGAELEHLKPQREPLKRRLDKVRTRQVATIRNMLSTYEQRANVYMGNAHVLGF
jgi:hypothetical protein